MKTHTVTDKLIMALGLIGLVVASCTPAPATAQSAEQGQITVIVHGASKHSDLRNTVFNEQNMGAALRYNVNPELSAQTGIYHNSYFKTTAYAIGQYMPLGNNTLRAGVFAGLASGYSSVTNYPIVGGLVADINIIQGVVYTVRHIPKVGDGTASVTALEIGFRF